MDILQAISNMDPATRTMLNALTSMPNTAQSSGVQRNHTAARKVFNPDDAHKVEGNRYVNVNTYRDRVYVNIRDYEHDEKTGNLHYTRSGINLTAKQWEIIQKMTPWIEAKLEKLKSEGFSN